MSVCSSAASRAQGSQVHLIVSRHGGIQYADYVVLAAAAVGVAFLVARRPWQRAS